MRNWLIWQWLFTKRLLKKKLFLGLLLVLPLLVLCGMAIDWEDSGAVTVVLAAETPRDALAEQVMTQLQADSNWIRFREAATAELAAELVRAGEADAAWIFPTDFEERMTQFVQDKSTKVVRILQREETVLLRLTSETLGGALYRLWAEPVYLQYLAEHAPELAALSREELLTYPELFEGNENLFEFSVIGGISAAGTTNFLIAPLRGLLGIWILLCALAVEMYYEHDLGNGTFAALRQRQRPLAELSSLLAALPGISVAALIALGVAGMWENSGRQILVAMLYMLCCGSFSALLRRICRSVPTMAAILPILTVTMLLVCPVFFDLAVLSPIQYLLPPTYYIQALYADRFLLLMPVYTGICIAGCFCFPEKT